MTESAHHPHLFADITAKPGMGALFMRLIGPTIATRETPVIQAMAASAIDGFGPTLRHVVIDLGAITFMNSGGLGMLVECRTRASKCNKAKVILLGPTAELQSLLKMVKLDRLFTIANDANELAAAMGR